MGVVGRGVGGNVFSGGRVGVGGCAVGEPLIVIKVGRLVGQRVGLSVPLGVRGIGVGCPTTSVGGRVGVGGDGAIEQAPLRHTPGGTRRGHVTLAAGGTELQPCVARHCASVAQRTATGRA